MILVTGASGFLGQHLLTALSQRGEQVRALYLNQKERPEYANVSWFSCDLLDVIAVEEAMKDIDYVYNCAATVSFKPKDKNKLILDNVAMVENIVNAAVSSRVRKLIHVSSVAALGRPTKTKAGQSIKENNHFEEKGNNSRYAVGKYLGELEVWRGMAEGLNAAILNPAIILGEGDWSKGSAELMQICYDEFPWYTKGITAWVDVKDVVSAMLLLMDSKISEERFILNSGNFAYKDIFTQMANALDKKPPHLYARKWLTEIIWRLALLKSKITGKETGITRETIHIARQKYTYNNEKFLNAFPEFKYTPINETIQRMAKAFLQDINIAL